MKKTIILLTLLLLAACAKQETLTDGHTPTQEHLLEHALAESQAQEVQSTDFSQYDGLRKTTLQFEGMTCPSCALGVEYELNAVSGVVQTKVDYANKIGFVVYEPGKINPEEIAASSTAYPAQVISDAVYGQ